MASSMACSAAKLVTRLDLAGQYRIEGRVVQIEQHNHAVAVAFFIEQRCRLTLDPLGRQDQRLAGLAGEHSLQIRAFVVGEFRFLRLSSYRAKQQRCEQRTNR